MQYPNSGPAVSPPDETSARRFEADLEDLSDSSSSSSSNRESLMMSSGASRNSSVTTDLKDLERASNGQKGGRKSREWYRLKIIMSFLFKEITKTTLPNAPSTLSPHRLNVCLLFSSHTQDISPSPCSHKTGYSQPQTFAFGMD